MTNFEFQNWKVLERATQQTSSNIRWTCQCQECKRIKDFCGSEIRLGRTGVCNHPDYSKHPSPKKDGAIIDETGKQYGLLTVIDFSHTEKSHAYWLCQCKCGNQIVVRGNHLRTNRVHSCGCLRSYQEMQIAQILKDNNIDFVREYTFKDLQDRGKLRFDFAIFDNNILLGLIEYQGEQHFSKPEKFNHYGLLQKHDKMKVEYCEQYKIPLLILDKNCDLVQSVQIWLSHIQNKIAI